MPQKEGNLNRATSGLKSRETIKNRENRIVKAQDQTMVEPVARRAGEYGEAVQVNCSQIS